MRDPILRLHLDDRELVVDNFAGGGGASTGIELATGRSPDIAVNHDADALAMHEANHPSTRHMREDVWDVDPVAVCGGRPVGLAWFSPDCTFFSKARGAKPFRDRRRATRRRALAHIVVRWASAVRPRVICMENVEEFEDWGPLGPDGLPDPDRIGLSFRRWRRQLENLGYAVEWRQLRACDYGAPTTRKRLFVVARCDGAPIVWPTPTHGPGRSQPYRTAAECIDWTIPVPSIFGRSRPLAENTLRRIARGLRRFVLEAPRPFVVPVSGSLAAPFLTEHANASSQRIFAADEPLRTQCANVKGGHFALVTAFLARHYGGNENDGADLRQPMHTITTQDHHAAVTVQLGMFDAPAPQPWRADEVRAFLVKFYGNEQEGHSLQLPLGTVTTKDRFGLVTVAGREYQIVDIGMRMLAPRELFRAQGFPEGYVVETGADGRVLTKTAQVRMVGNSVAPPAAAALVAANLAQRAAATEAA